MVRPFGKDIFAQSCCLHPACTCLHMAWLAKAVAAAGGSEFCWVPFHLH